MTSTRPRSRGLSLTVAALLLLLTPVPAPSQEAPPAPPPPPEKPPAEILDAAAGEQTAANGEASASQERVNQLDDETQRLLVRYRTAVGEAESIKGYSDQLRLQIQSQEEDIASIERQLSEVETTAREVMPLTQKMLDTLAEFVELDMPILIEERRERIAGLRGIMNRADVSLSEKYRRVVEAYQIEMEYGRTLETYDGRIGEGDDERTVQFLRVGRVVLMYQTLGGDETGYWDANSRSWVVDNSYRNAFKRGLGVAKKQTAPDVIVAPIPAPKESAS
jgi:flagellar motility protein MotE (MotC chaperone)